MSNVPPPAISVRNLYVSYRDALAIHDISFDVYDGERLAIIGPNGAGKSTLMKALIGILQPQSGQIAFPDGGQWTCLGYVPQYDEVRLDFPVSVYDVVMMGLTREIGWLRFPNRNHRERVEKVLERVGMLHYKDRQISELSGGQRRRVFIARALVRDAHILLLDEPFASVDTGARADLMNVLEMLHSEGLTIIQSTHDIGLAFSHFDRVMALNQTIIALGEPSSIYTPDMLSALYSTSITQIQDGTQTLVFIDDSH